MQLNTPPPFRLALLAFIFLSFGCRTQAADSTTTPTVASLPPPPAPMGAPAPAPATDAPYAPQPILPGGVVIPLFPPDSSYLKVERIREPEVYSMGAPGQIA